MKHSAKLKNNKKEVQQNDDVDEDVAMERIEIPGDIVQTLTVPRGPVSTKLVVTSIKQSHALKGF
jgi:hypothetical protein